MFAHTKYSCYTVLKDTKGVLMSEKMTLKQTEVFNYIKQYIELNSFPPTVRDIAKALGVSSPATIHGHINALVSKGLLERCDNKSRAITLVRNAEETSSVIEQDPSFYTGEVIAVPVLGSVAAGSPILAEENIEDTYVLPSSVVQGETYMLRIKGDSMINVGIFDNDLVIVRKQNTAQNGDIVVALIDDGATVKTFYREGSRIRLQPENDTLEAFYPENLLIAGKVVGLMRMGM